MVSESDGSAEDPLYDKGLDIDAILHQVYLRTGHVIARDDPIVAALIGNDVLYKYMFDAVRRSILAVDGSNELLHKNLSDQILDLRQSLERQLEEQRKAGGARRFRLHIWLAAMLGYVLTVLVVGLLLLGGLR